MLIPTEVRSACSGVLAALAVLSLPALCAAQTSGPRASLVVTRGEGAQACPDAATLAEQVRAVVGANVIGVELASTPEEPVETWVQVAITHDFGGYRALISTLGRHQGTRTLEDLGPGCASLADAMALTIAIFLDPYSSTPLPPRVAAVETAPVPPPVKPTPREQPAAHLEPFVDLFGGVASMLEHSEPVLGLSFGLYLTDRWSLALGGSYVFSDTKSNDGGHITLGLTYGYALGCGRVLGARDGARVDWCGAPLLGSLSGGGIDYTSSNDSKSRFWLAVAAGPQIVFPFSSSLSGVLAAQAVLPLIRRGFDDEVAGNRGTVFTPEAAAGLASFGIRGAL